MKLVFQAQAGDFDLDVSIESEAPHWVVTGPNGAGKSTLLGLMLGVIPAKKAFLQVGNTVLVDSEQKVLLPTEKRRLAYVPQDYALFPHMTVRENLAFAVESAGGNLDDMDSALEALSLQPWVRQFPHQLSGGEKQKVALARALATRPRALLFDEPLASLDVVSRKALRSFLAKTLSEWQLPTLVVTHDPLDAQMLGTFFVVLENGRVRQQGSWSDLSSAPASDFVATFVTER